jgi:hypothetical protein
MAEAATRTQPPPPLDGPLRAAGIDERCSQIGAYFLGQRHRLIHRHLEKVTIAPDQTARWQLTIDLELPTDPIAECGSHDGESRFLFPLMYLKKAEGRTGFGASQEDGTAVPLPTRKTSDRVSAIAIAQAAAELVPDEIDEDAPDSVPHLPNDSLRYVAHCIASEQPYNASVILNELLRWLDPRIRAAWDSAGLTSVLKMLVEHYLVWVPLRGLPGERRQINVGQDVELLPRPFRRWRFGQAKKRWYSGMFWLRARRFRDPAQVLDTGRGRKYGKLGRRISFSVLGERLALPFAWLPIEFDFPTIYTRRCSSYHFELVCPNGLSPRGIKLVTNARGEDGKALRLEGGETLGTRSGRLYLPRGRSLGDLTIRATVGIGRGTFPILWLLMGTITAVMLWSLVSANPTWLIHGAEHSENEVATGILLIVPALLGALVIGFEGSTSRILGGARVLLLAAGLAAAASAAVLVGTTPLGFQARAIWTICASVATAATIPLATSWLLSLPLVWRSLGRLNSTRRQYFALSIVLAICIGLVLGLMLLSLDILGREALAVGILVMTVPLILLASDRPAVPIATSRRFISIAVALAAFVCLGVGCCEMRKALDPTAGYNDTAEIFALVLLPVALLIGLGLSYVTNFAREKKDEVHIAPAALRGLVSGGRTPELLRLRPGSRQPEPPPSSPDALDEPYGLVLIDQPVVEEPARGTEADWSWGVRSTVDLPAYEEGEFEHLLNREPQASAEPESPSQVETTKLKLKEHMDALVGAQRE